MMIEPDTRIAVPSTASPPGDADPVRVAALEAEVGTLRAELRQARRVLASASEYAIVPLNMEGCVTGWNPGARNILGYAEAEILGHSGEIFFTPEGRVEEAFTKEMCLALEWGRATNERWHLRKDGTRFWASGVMLPLLDEDGHPQGFLNIMRDGTERHAETERRALVEAELVHRVKNTLSLAHVVAMQSQRYADTPEAFQEAFGSRLRALGRSHEMLARDGWDGAPLGEVIGRALAPYEGPPGRTSMDGLPLRLSSAAVVSLSLVFHELATNAAKYGALSVPEGGVEVTWTRTHAGCGKPLLEIVWREHGGPPVERPERRGFGSRLLEQGLRHEFGCEVALDFVPAGLECRLRLPLTAHVLGT